jgi:hypothetical protein
LKQGRTYYWYIVLDLRNGGGFKNTGDWTPSRNYQMNEAEEYIRLLCIETASLPKNARVVDFFIS